MVVANASGPASLAGLARETGAYAAFVEDAARGNDVVVIAVPMKQIGKLPPGLLADGPAEMIVADTRNYYPQQRDGRIDKPEAGLTESIWVEWLLGRPVVKAFNMAVALHLLDGGKPEGTAGRIAMAVAGNDPAAKATVMRLVNEIGVDPVDAGTIGQSWCQQPGHVCVTSVEAA